MEETLDDVVTLDISGEVDDLVAQDVVTETQIKEEEDINNLPIEILIYRDSATVIEPTVTDFSNRIVKKIVKTIKVESLIRAFSETEVDIVSPILPPSCIKYREKGNKVVIVCLHEEKYFDAIVLGKEYKNCIRPNIVMIYTLNKSDNNYSINNTQAFGIKDPINMVGPDTILYGLPFPNIGADGWVCWGNNSTSGTFKSLVGLNTYIGRLFAAPFNDHLFSSGILSGFGIRTPHDLFAAIQDKQHFDTNMLENLGREKTLRSC